MHIVLLFFPSSAVYGHTCCSGVSRLTDNGQHFVCRSLFQYKDCLSWNRDFHYIYKTVMRPFYLYNGNYYAGLTKILYWTDPLIAWYLHIDLQQTHCWCPHIQCERWDQFQCLRRFIVSSHKVSKSRDLRLKWSDRFQIWQALKSRNTSHSSIVGISWRELAVVVTRRPF